MKTIICSTPIKGIQNKFYYLYKIVNNINNKFYYGVHTSSQVPNNYCGSGSRLKLAYKKYGKDSFTKYILEFFTDHEEMLNKERIVVNDELLKNDKCYNLVLGGGEINSIGKSVVKDLSGNIFQLDKNDPRIGVEYFSINKGLCICRDIANDKIVKVPVNDPRIKSGELIGISKGLCCMKDTNNKIVKVSVDDPRIKSGELQSIVKNTVSVTDIKGNKFRVNKNDPRIGKILFYHTTNRITIIDKKGITKSVPVDDPRIKSGEYISVNKNRIYITKNGLNKMIYIKDLQKYLDDGWNRGMSKKGDRIVNKNGKNILIKNSDLQKYLDDGWNVGQYYDKPKTGRPKSK